MRTVLASGSPRRRELLSMVGLVDFEVIPAEGEEVMMPGLTPEQTVCSIARQKAKNVSLRCDPDALVIAADTLVYLDGRPLGKPDGPEDAAAMLRQLSGRRHEVYTGLTVLRGNTDATEAVRTDVYFRRMTDEEIDAYVGTGEPMDKAGAYAAQGRGSIFIERIEGEFFNVMGLPICRLSLMLKENGVI